MDAPMVRAACAAAILSVSLGASYRTANFVVTAPTPEVAQAVGEAAERYRRELAQEWLGHALPNWSRPCPVEVMVGPQLGAGGATSFVFDRGEVFGWQMTIQGSLERVLDSVLPHEVTHTIFASHFRQPLPRWADEGACSTVEHASERAKHQRMLITFLKTGRGIPFQRMFAMTEYPRDVLPLYAQGHSLASFLIQQGGRRKFLAYIAEGMQDGRWASATLRHYGYQDLGSLQDAWLQWVRSGSPPLSTTPARTNTPASLAQDVPPNAQADPAQQASSEDQLVAVVRSRTTAGASAAAGGRRLPQTAPAQSATTPARRGEWRPAGIAPRTSTSTQASPPAQLAAATEQTDSIRSAVHRPPTVQKLRQMIIQWDSRSPSHTPVPSTPQPPGAGADSDTLDTPQPPYEPPAGSLAAAPGADAGWQPVSPSRPRSGHSSPATPSAAEAWEQPDGTPSSADAPASASSRTDDADWWPSVYDVRAATPTTRR